MPIINRVADLHPEIAAWRRDIHAHPELLFDVHRTAAIVANDTGSARWCCSHSTNGCQAAAVRAAVPDEMAVEGNVTGARTVIPISAH